MNDVEPFAVETVLAPLDGSEEAVTAAEYAVGVADRYEATLHALYVLGRGVVRGMDVGTVPEDDVANSTTAVLDDVRMLAEEAAVPISTSVTHGFSQAQKTRHPGSVVLDAADAVGADFIVVPRESVTDASTDSLEKVAEYVLSYASQPVLSV